MVEVNKKEKYQVAVAKYLIGDLPIEQLPNLASDAIENGIDASTVIEIAGIKNPNYFVIQELMPKFLGELGLPPLSKEEAGLYLAKADARKIVSGEMDPEAGAKELERLWFKLECFPKELQNFSLADEHIGALPMTCDKRDIPEVREKMRRRIISDAKDMLEGKPLKDRDMKDFVSPVQ